MALAAEFAAKQAHVAAWLEERRADAALLCAPATVAWLSCGGELNLGPGAAGYVVTAERSYLLCPAEDVDRTRQEEVRGLPVDVVAVLSLSIDALVDRARGLLPEATRWRTDTVGLGLERDASIDNLRRVLGPEDEERFVRLARDAAAAVEEVAAECYRGVGERDAAARLAAECVRRQMTPREILAGADERFETYARPLPKGATAERVLMLGLVATRGGLHVAVSRTLCFTRPEEPFLQRFASGLDIMARLHHETRCGETLGTVVQRALPQPPMHLGSLGGTTGFAYPEHEARVSSSWKLGPRQGVVWSVASAGMRIENTSILTPTGLQVASMTDGWPRRTVRIDQTPHELPDLLLL